MTAPARRLTAKRKGRIQQLKLSYSMSTRLYPPVDGERMVGESTWNIDASDEGQDIAWLRVHRVPLNNQEPVASHLEHGSFVPSAPADAVMGKWDELSESIVDRLSRLSPPVDPGFLGASFLIVETGWIHADWRNLGVGALVLCTAMSELVRSDDVIAVSSQSGLTVPRADKALITSEWRSALSAVGFIRYRGAAMLLTDIWKPGEALESLQARFEFPNALYDFKNGPPP